MKIWTVLISGVIFMLLTGFVSAQAATNAHDHLWLMPRAGDFAAAVERKPVSDPPLTEVFPNDDSLQRYLRLVVGLTAVDAARSPLGRAHSWRLFEFLRHLRGETDQTWEALLSFRPMGNAVDNRFVFDAYADLRKFIYLHSTPEAIEEVFRRYFADERDSNRSGIWASASFTAFEGPQIEKLARIREVARSFRGDIRFLIAINRYKWAFDKFRWPYDWEDLRARDLIHGIDLNGSIEEARNPRWEDALPSQFFERKFTDLFRTAARLGVPLRVHMFEHHNVGTFYEGFRVALAAFREPLRLIFGHMAQMTPHWLRFFRELPANFDLRFQITPPSYEQLIEEFSPHRLDDLVREARRLGFVVEEGFDGRGLFENTWPHPTPSLHHCQRWLKP